jgi:hypothetical protein
MADPDARTESPKLPGRALRLIFSYKGTKAKLESQHAVEMIVPPSHPMDEDAPQSGFWFEVRDAQERVLYRRSLHDPMQSALEAPSGDPTRPFTRVAARDPEGTFVVLVPALDAAHVVTVRAGPLDAHTKDVREIVRVSLKAGGEPGGTRDGPGVPPGRPGKGKPRARKGRKQ